MNKKKKEPKPEKPLAKTKPSRWRENLREEIDETVARVDERLKRQREKDDE